MTVSCQMPQNWHNMRSINIESFFAFLNVCCTLAFILQFSLLLMDLINPTVTNTVIYQNNLSQIAFPVMFKLCASPGILDLKDMSAQQSERQGSF